MRLHRMYEDQHRITFLNFLKRNPTTNGIWDVHDTALIARERERKRERERERERVEDERERERERSIWDVHDTLLSFFATVLICFKVSVIALDLRNMPFWDLQRLGSPCSLHTEGCYPLITTGHPRIPSH